MVDSWMAKQDSVSAASTTWPSPVTVRRYSAASAPCAANMPARLSPSDNASRGGGPPGKPFMCRSPLAASATDA
jgi:hypothetical protein